MIVATLEDTPREGDALVAGDDGCTSGVVEVHHRADLAGLQPQAAPGRGFKLSTDPLFVEKVVDVVGLYHNPPETGGRTLRR